MREYRSAISKFAALGFRDWLLLARAQRALVAAQLDVWMRPQGELLGASIVPTAVPRQASRHSDAERSAHAVRRVAKYGVFRPTCLVRSLAICRVLSAQRIEGARIRIGVALRSERFVAHAWVEFDGAVIGDDDDVARRFATLDDLKVVAVD